MSRVKKSQQPRKWVTRNTPRSMSHRHTMLINVTHAKVLQFASVDKSCGPVGVIWCKVSYRRNILPTATALEVCTLWALSSLLSLQTRNICGYKCKSKTDGKKVLMHALSRQIFVRHVTQCLNGSATYGQQSYLLLESLAKLHDISHFALTNSGILRYVIRTSLPKVLFTATEITPSRQQSPPAR